MDPDYRREHEALLEEIEAEVRETRRYLGKAALSARVMQAMRRVARHDFVPEEARRLAYANHPLPIGHGQTISQPYIVALMTDLAELTEDSIVLEVGTGSGYQAAVLATLAREVYSVEIVPTLAQAAATRLAALGYKNVRVRKGNGRAGWPEHAPYDAILVTAAAEGIPDALIEQLKPGGRLVIPIGEPFRGQTLTLVTKDATGRIKERAVLPVAFVPLTGKE